MFRLGTIAQEFHKWPSETNDAWAFGSRSYVPQKFRDDPEIKAAYERSRSLFLVTRITLESLETMMAWSSMSIWSHAQSLVEAVGSAELIEQQSRKTR